MSYDVRNLSGERGSTKNKTARDDLEIIIYFIYFIHNLYSPFTSATCDRRHTSLITHDEKEQ